MSLSKKYNIPAETIDRMVKDGVISCSWPMYEQIFSDYTNLSVGGKSQVQVRVEVAEKNKVSEETVRKVLYKFR